MTELERLRKAIHEASTDKERQDAWTKLLAIAAEQDLEDIVQNLVMDYDEEVVDYDGLVKNVVKLVLDYHDVKTSSTSHVTISSRK